LAAPEDCFTLAPNLREEDVQEILHASGLSPLHGLIHSFRPGTTLAVVWGDEVVALFGHSGDPGEVGYPWMLASPALSKIRKSFLRECRRHVQEMLDIYGYLTNFVWAHNTVHIKWLQWLGFEILPETYHT